MFDYVLPGLVQSHPQAPSHGLIVGSAPSQPTPRREEKTGDQPTTDKPDEGDTASDDKNKLYTQMVGEKPGDDLGYDPRIIPTEPIPD